MPDESFWAFDDDEPLEDASGRTLQIQLTKAERVAWVGVCRDEASGLLWTPR